MQCSIQVEVEVEKTRLFDKKHFCLVAVAVDEASCALSLIKLADRI